MSNVTIATLRRISRDELASLLKEQPLSNPSTKIAVVDVREQDYIGGHILGSSHVPVASLDYRTPELVRQLKDKNTVVFHCALSQQRGPSAALQYLREKERVDGSSKGEDSIDEQKVYVLDGGFNQWQKKYGEDERLTEGYQRDIWEFGN